MARKIVRSKYFLVNGKLGKAEALYVPTKKDIVRGLGTVYETDYYPEGTITGRQIRQLKKQGARRARRIFGEQ